ncbi:MAG TPA: alpha/beta fold hydrolase, partial [Caldilineaceae bacterium]|nr:alpha/beta fold hydrolase [Caldilineaceae bacterium]
PAATSSGSLLTVSPSTLSNSTLSTSPVSAAVETALAAPAETGLPEALPVLQLGVDELLELSDIALSINAVLEAQPGPDGLHPLTIAYLRRRSYPGSALTVEQTLTPGVNYTRSLVSYRSEGLKINALLTTPTGPRPSTGWPVVIFNHGYIPPALYQPTERYEAYVDAFARNGYMVLRPDLRGHGASDGEARGAYGDPGYTIDVLNALASIRQHPDADPNRIGMWGHSMGGYLTLRAMVVSGDIKAGVVWSGVVASYAEMLDLWTSQARYLPEQAQRWRDALVALYGTPESNPAFWNTISANSYLADLSGPVQLHHGSADPVVPQHFSDLLYQELLEAGKPVEYYTYAGDDHNISAYFELAMARSLAFMDRYVKGQ